MDANTFSRKESLYTTEHLKKRLLGIDCKLLEAFVS